MDESGDLGFSRFSSKYFIISAIVTENPKPLERIPKQIRRKRLKKSLLRKPELKFHNTSPQIRRIVLEKVMALNGISIASVVTRKAGMPDRLKHDQGFFYDQICADLILRVIEYQGRQASYHAVFDARPHNRPPSYDFRNRVGTIVDREMARKVLRPANLSVSVVDSRNSGGLQVADFIAGAIQRRFEQGDPSYFELIAPAIAIEERLF